MRGSDYAELRAFAAIVEYGNFARAAARLGMSASALSQTIRGLEERLGVRLLNRTTRSVAPTEAGVRLVERLVPAMDEIEAAVTDIHALRDKPSGPLRINAPRVAATRFIGPILGRFLEAYPDIILDIEVEDRLVDIVGGRFDAGIRLGERLAKDMVALSLGGELQMAMVATPDYLARHGVPATPRELQRHRCINFRWPTDGSLYQWELERGGEKVEVAVSGPLLVTDIDVIMQALLGHVGIGYMFEYQAEPYLKDGRLIRIMADWTPSFPGFYLYYPSRRQMPPPLRAFIDFLRKEGTLSG